MSDESMLKPALIGGVLLGILSSLPIVSALNCICFAWVIGGGLLAAYLYVKDSSVPVTLGRGVGLGLLTGFIGTIVNALFMIPWYFLFSRAGMGFREAFNEALRQVPNLPPEAEAALRALVSKEGIGILFITVGLIFTLVIYCLAAMLGGAIGVALFEKRKTGSSPPAPGPMISPSGFPPSSQA